MGGDDEMPLAKPAPRKPRAPQKRRLATELQILAAFGRLMERDGLHAAGVNALVKEASVGKKQIYEYFGGLEGVAQAWVQRTAFWPRGEDLIAEPLDSFLARPPLERLRILVRVYAQALRDNPAVATLMAGEFAGPPELRAAVEATRVRIWQEYERLFFAEARSLDQDILALNVVLLPAVTYIGLRARFDPRFFGFDLQSEASWAAVLGMIDRVIALAAEGRAAGGERRVD
jgi:AcrR family transcriptional regulator